MNYCIKKGLLLLFIFFSLNSYCQDYSTKSKRAARLFQSAHYNYSLKYFNKAEQELEEILKIDTDFIEAYLLKAELHYDMKEYQKAIDAYQNAIRIDPKFTPLIYFYLGETLMLLGNYDSAKESIKKVLEFDNISSKRIAKAKYLIKQCEFISYALDNPVPFSPHHLGESLNIGNSYWPSISIDESTLIFTSLVKKSIVNQYDNVLNMQEDFFISRKINEEWSEAVNIGSPLNTLANEGTHTITPDEKYFYFTACNRKSSYGGCDIYYSQKTGNQWGRPENIGGIINSTSWESQPSISADGSTLYFVSNRKGGKGKNDIWYSNLVSYTPMGKPIWGEVFNMGDSINTIGNETAPYIHYDNTTLYFSSDYHIGMGKSDIFMSSKKNTNNWSTPQNLGYPINTDKNEEGICINSTGDRAYFSASYGHHRSLFYFSLYEDIRPNAVNALKGIIKDQKTKKTLEAKVALSDLDNGEIIAETFSNKEKGMFTISLPPNKGYSFSISKPGYLFYSDKLLLEDTKMPYTSDTLEIELQPIDIGSKIVLENIFFEINSYELKEKSIVELNKLIYFMNNNHNIVIEIGGHTDNTSSDLYNLQLSEQRAKSVYTYLLNKYISAERISYKGYGNKKPIADNNTEEGKAKNRRTEVIIKEIMID